MPYDERKYIFYRYSKQNHFSISEIPSRIYHSKPVFRLQAARSEVRKPAIAKKFLLSLQLIGNLWVSHIHLFHGYSGFFTGAKAAAARIWLFPSL
jgi:hypothetical protein